MQPYVTVSSASETELIINRSRFIGRCLPVSSEEEALCALEGIKKRHWDATHNCFAYRIGALANPARFSDDGEPGGTAGRPIMDVLTAKQLTDTLIVVTRYFGGVLLGAGGLVRAYSRAASDSAAAAGMVLMQPAKLVELRLDYSRHSALAGYLEQTLHGVTAEYTDVVTLRGTIAQSGLADFSAELTRRTDGRVSAECVGEEYLPAPVEE